MKIKRILIIASIGAALMVAAQSHAGQTDENSIQNYATMNQVMIDAHAGPVLEAVPLKQVQSYNVSDLVVNALQADSVASGTPDEPDKLIVGGNSIVNSLNGSMLADMSTGSGSVYSGDSSGSGCHLASINRTDE